MKEQKLDDWIKITEIKNELTINILVGAMDKEGIEVRTLNKKDASYHFGYIEVYVRYKDKSKAEEVLSLNEFL